MKRALLLLVLGMVAAPAAAAQPVDFELAAPYDAVLGTRLSASSGVISKPLRAPGRFNLVGLRWRGPGEVGVALRTRTDGGRWTRWTTAYTHLEDAPDPGTGEPGGPRTSNPVWVGKADWVQYRMSRHVRGVRLHFVNVEGAARPRARPAQEQPGVVAREEWAGDDCEPRSAPELGEVKAAFIHHTVTANDYTPEESPQIVLGICRFHRNSNGWNDVGYNFLVDKYGTVYEGRAGGIDQPIVGAQAQGYNAQSTGIANLGTHTSLPQTPESLEAIARLIRWKLPLHGTSTSGSVVLTSTGGSANKYPAGTQVRVQKISGHRDTGATACPGEALYAQLPDLRDMVGNVPAALNGTTTSVGLIPPRVVFGGEVLASGRVLGSTRQALAGVPVELQRRSGGRWMRTAAATTGPDGTYSVALRPKANNLIRARYPGDGLLRPSNSVQRELGVRPVVTIVRPPRRGRSGRAVEVVGRVAPRKRTLHLAVQYFKNGRWGKPGVRTVRARLGAFETYFLPGRAGSWRFRVVSKADEKTLRGVSKPYELTVRD